jgi:hypothetical protein
MTKKEVEDFHDELFKYLMGIRQQNATNATFMFRVRRMNNQNRLDKGYWFNGNDSYIETSFWDYKDNLHQTPVMRLVYFFASNEWWCELIGRDSQEREAYFKKMVNTNTFKGYQNDRDIPIWRKLLGKGENENFINPLKSFIEKDKNLIDEYITTNKQEDLVKKIDPYIFSKDISRIEYAIQKRSDRANEQKKEHDSKYSEEANKVNSEVKFPYSLKTITIEKGYRGIHSLSIGEKGDDKDLPNTQWIFLTGENGFGKTSILRAIASALTDNESEDPSFDPEKVTFTAFNNGIEIPLDKEDEGEPNGKISNKIDKIVGYGISRFNPLSPLDDQERNKLPNTYNLIHEKGSLLSMERILLDSYHEKQTYQDDTFDNKS